MAQDSDVDLDRELFVVGIGASAGGLEPLTILLQRINFDRAAFLVMQHLAADPRALLTDILARTSHFRVVTMVDGMALEARTVYVAPPETEVRVEEGVLRLQPLPATHRPLLPIDTLLRSLAHAYGPYAIGVVLSGTGTDGTFGLAAIKAAGGITFAQDPPTARFDGMPRSAIESGAVDFRLAAESIADEITTVCSHAALGQRHSLLRFEEHLNKLTALLKSSFALDLSHYKLNTIERRLQRRMAVQRLERLEDYVRLCQSDPKELAALHRDLLINVTSFFRDREPFDALKTQVFPRMIENRREGSTIRIWVPGCSTGEEAYSIAICLLESIEASDRSIKVQIFGTDVDAEAIQQARRGVYPPNIAADVSPERLRQFFVKTDDGQYQISRRIRDSVVFSLQNISRDAPFSKLDLVSCRNLLIYLQPGIQQKVLRILHYSLQPGGVLLLGTSESVGDSSDLFTLVDRKNKIYVSKHVALSNSALDLGVGVPALHPTNETTQVGAVRPTISIAHLADRKILEQYAPPGVVVNQNLDILYFCGRTSPYLEQPSGVATHNILRLVRPELNPPLRKAIDDVLASGEPSVVDAQLRDVQVGFRGVQLVVQPLQEPETRARCLLILFKEASEPNERAAASDPVSEASANSDHARVLAQELALTKDYLQSTIEELERANEDLKSANEELQSSNEELQSTNEELETSKEELQSTNEELITLNEELQNRMRDLSTANDDLHNILLGVDRPVIIVGLDHRIRRFTASAERAMNLVPTDIGRSAAQLSTFLNAPWLEQTIARSIEDVMTLEQEAVATDRRAYMVRVVPYKTLDLTIRGAVITLIELDPSRRRPDPSSPAPDSASA